MASVRMLRWNARTNQQQQQSTEATAASAHELKIDYVAGQFLIFGPENTTMCGRRYKRGNL